MKCKHPLCWQVKCIRSYILSWFWIHSQNMHFSTGCIVWNFANSNGCRTITVHIWPYVGKAKMCFIGGRFFGKFKQTAEKCKQIFKNWKKKTTASQTHFIFTNIGSNMHCFCATAIWNLEISNDTPCMLVFWCNTYFEFTCPGWNPIFSTARWIHKNHLTLAIFNKGWVKMHPLCNT